MTIGKAASIISVVALFVVASCGDVTSPRPVDECGKTLACEPPPVVVTPATGVDLAAARAHWVANRPASYEYTLRLGCFCVPELNRPVVVVVSGTTVTSRKYADDGTALAAQFAEWFPSVDGLFDMVADAKSKNAEHTDMTFDTTVGFPLSVVIDYKRSMADDESYYTISGFKAR